jgi:hypothetical protein
MTLREAWFMIARLIYSGHGPWMCNLAVQLPVSVPVYDQIIARIAKERDRQGMQSGDSLWRSISAQSAKGRIVRLQFIAQVLRELA